MKNTDVNLGKRFLCYLIDWYVGALCSAIPISIVSQKLYKTMLNQSILDFPSPIGLYAGIVSVCFGLFYFLIVPTYINKGQTFGKKICHLKVVQKNGKEVTIKNMFLRQVVGIILIEGCLVTSSAMFHQILTLIFHINFVKPLMYVGIGISLISVALVVFGPEHRAIHDYVGNTKVTLSK